MTIAKVGRRGSLVIPSEARRKARIKEGDHVEVSVLGPEKLTIKRISSLEEIQERMAGKLPDWKELEGKADKLVEEEL